MMDQRQRLLLAAMAIGWVIFRLVRYLRVGTSKRAPAAIPASAGIVAQLPTPAAPPAAATASPIEPDGRGSGGLVPKLAGLLVWLAGNAAVWGCLFLIPPLEQVPVMLRLVAGVLANFYLIHLGRAAAARARRQTDLSSDRNPIK